MSLKTIPVFGKSGMSRIARRRSSMSGTGALMADVTLSEYGERSWEIVECGQRKLADVIDPCTWRPCARGGQQIGDSRFRSRGRDLHAAIGVVSHPPSESAATSCFAHEPPESNALDLPYDFDMNCLDRLQRCHSSSAAARPS